MKKLNEHVAEIILPSLGAMGLGVVDIKMVDGAKRKTLQILLENLQTGNLKVAECTMASRAISTLLEVNEVIAGDFNLEVSSPGIDRPLIDRLDYERFMGFEAKLDTALPLDGRRHFRGILKAIDDTDVTIFIDGKDFKVAMEMIQSAKLMLTDALLKAHKDGKIPPKFPANETPTQTTIGA